MRKKRVRRGGYVARARHYASRARGFGGGMFGPVIQGVLGGLAAQIGQSFLPGYGAPLGLGGVGYFLNNPTLLTMAGIQASALIPVGGFLGGGTGSGSGGAI